MLACPARGLCADMTAYPHKVVGAAQGSPRVKHTARPVETPARPRIRAIARRRPSP